MASITQSVVLSSGATGEYWNIDKVDIDFNLNQAIVYLSLYVNQQAQANGYAPIMKQTVLYSASAAPQASNIGILDANAQAIQGNPAQLATYLNSVAGAASQAALQAPVPPYAFDPSVLGVDLGAYIQTQLGNLSQFNGGAIQANPPKI